MAKYVVEGLIRVQMTVEADSEDEALEMAEESFDFEKNVDQETIPSFETANLVGIDIEEDDDEVYAARTSRPSYDDEEED